MCLLPLKEMNLKNGSYLLTREVTTEPSNTPVILIMSQTPRQTPLLNTLGLAVVVSMLWTHYTY